MDGSFTAQPVLCESYTVSPDKLTWTFTLRGGVTFSDGTSLTGEVAAAALELARGEGSRYSGRLSHVTSITAGEGTVTVTLDEPNGSLPCCWTSRWPWGQGSALWEPAHTFCRKTGRRRS